MGFHFQCKISPHFHFEQQNRKIEKSKSQIVTPYCHIIYTFECAMHFIQCGTEANGRIKVNSTIEHRLNALRCKLIRIVEMKADGRA